VEEAIGGAFNIGNPRNAVTVYELAKKTVSACGSRSDIVFKSPPFRDIDVRVPEIALARDVLGFAPRVELEDGLARTIAWVKRHADVLGPSWAA
jgi:nucleoside-diphosphate-sugar epimerase